MAKIQTGSKTVTIAGTAERLATVAASVPVRSITVVAKGTNSGAVYVGASDVASTTAPALEPGDSITIAAPDPATLSDVWVNAAVSGEGIDYVAVS